MSTFTSQANDNSHPIWSTKRVFSRISWLTLALGGSVFLTPEIAISQPITPETGANGTGTIITTPDGQQFDINGGARSGDGANLFHSFQQFGLNQGQTANFISNPQIQNILGRVVGGDPSVINGLIQITGGNSNLFLMNPAGILFGPNASLNIPADFTATTANSIGFGNNQWFNGFGSNDYINLVGIPSAFSFNMSQLGTIINEGNLTLTNGSNLNLFANTVINTGTLSTPFGNINITAVPSDLVGWVEERNPTTDKGKSGGDYILRISQPGHILSLEIIPTSNNNQSLPQLLTGGDPIHHATTVEKLEDGTIRLTGSQTPIPLEPGVAVVSGNVDTVGARHQQSPGLTTNVNDAVPPPQEPGNQINILGDKIALIGANIDASGSNGGGNIHIGLETGFLADNLDSDTKPLISETRFLSTFAATHTYIDPNTTISANAINSGNGGEIIIWSDNTTQFHGHISATGIENGGFVEVSGKQNLIFRGNVDLSAISGNTGTLLLDPENIYIVNGAGALDDAKIADAQILWNEPFGFSYGTYYTISEKALESLNGNANVTLQATNDIVIDDLADNKLAFKPGFSSINIAADYDNDGWGSFVMSPGDKITAPGRTLYITAADIITGSIDTGNTGNVSLYTSWGSIQQADATTQITANNAILTAPNGIGTAGQPLEINVGKLEVTLGAGGAFLNSPNSGVTLGGIYANSAAVAIYNGGTFSLTAAGDIIANTGQFISTNNNSSGHIILNSTTGGININGFGYGYLNSSYYDGDSGTISLTAANDINIVGAGLYSSSINGKGGDISITSTSGSVNITNSAIDSYAQAGNAGNIIIKAAGDINIPFPTTISTYSVSGNGGDLDINSTTGGINIGNIRSVSESQDAGSIKLEAAGDINTLSIYASAIGNGGNIDIISHTGNINTSNGQLISFTAAATAGSINLQAAGNITTGLIDAYAELAPNSNTTTGSGGDITINSTGGTVNTSFGSIRSYATYGDAGDVKIEAAGDITTSYITSLTYSPNPSAIGLDINTAGGLSGGNITITSTTGKISARGALNSASNSAIAGNITLDAPKGIDISNISSLGGQEGGSISITTDTDLDLSQATLNSSSSEGIGGDVTLLATGNISLGGDRENSAIRTEGSLQGGNITIISETGKISARGALNSASNSAIAGNITLDAPKGIDISNISSLGGQEGGSISITTDTDLDLSKATLNSFSSEGIGGNVTLLATGNISLGGDGENSAISTEGSLQGGNITITSETGKISASGALNSTSNSAIAGNITLDAPKGIDISNISSLGGQEGGSISITTDTDLDLSQATLNSSSSEGIGGNVTLLATGNISLGGDGENSAIRTEGSLQGGNITITSETGGVEASSGPLNTSSPKGKAGDVSLEAQSNITTAGIFADGDQAGGDIRISIDTGDISAERDDLNSQSLNGVAGSVTLEAPGNISTRDIYSQGYTIGGNVTISSREGKINTTGGNLYSFSPAGTAGNVILEAAGDITSLEIYSDGYSGGGNIILTSGLGKIDVSDGNLYSYSESGTAGNVTLNAPGDITVGNIHSEGQQLGGHIEITTGGSLDASYGTLNSYSEQGKAGDVELTANRNITLGGDEENSAIRSEGLQQGGNITITSTTGQIDSSKGSLDSHSQSGTAGNVTLEAEGNITNAGILSDGQQLGGHISLTSISGNIDVSADNLESYSESGTAGNVTLNAPGDITVGNIRSQGLQLGGHIEITAGGSLDASYGTLNSYSEQGQAGDVELTANRNITLGGDEENSAIRSEGLQLGGNITITSTTGQIDSSKGSLDSHSQSGTAGNVTLEAEGNITNAGILSDGQQLGGHISLTSISGNIDVSTGNLESYSESGTAGNVTLNAPGDITVGNIRSQGLQLGGHIEITAGGSLDASYGTLNSYSEQGQAGDVELTANGNITLGGDEENSAIRSEGLQQGGDIIITSNNGEAYSRAGSLDSFSEAGKAGNVFVRANGNVNTASIRSEGANQGGSIVILSFQGNVDTWGNLNSFSSLGTAGELAVQAKGNINTLGIRSDGYAQGGEVRLISANGAINTNWAAIDSYSLNGTAGAVLLEAPGSITTGAIRSEGLRQGGSITLNSHEAAINTAAGNLQSFSAVGTAGNVNLNAPGKITTGSIISYGRLVGGNISINSGSDEGIDTTAGVLETYSTDGNAGNVSLTAPGDIITGSHRYWLGNGCMVLGAPCLPPRALGANGEVFFGEEATDTVGQIWVIGSGIRSQGGQRGGKIEIISDRNVDTSQGNLDSYSENGIAGDVTINAGGSITANNITSYGNSQSGNVQIDSDNGAIRTGTIRTISPNGISGNVTLNTFSHQGDIITADITSEGGLAAGNITAKAPDGAITTGDLTSRSVEGDAGDITVAAGGDVETGDISSLGGGNSGDIAVTSTGGNVTTGDIESIAETGSAGDITVAAFGDVNTGTITSSGATGDGNVSVTSVTGTVTIDGTTVPEPEAVQMNQQPEVVAAIAPEAVSNPIPVAPSNNINVVAANLPTAENLPPEPIVPPAVVLENNGSNINNSVLVRAESNSSSGGDSSAKISLSTSNAEVAQTISVLSSSPLAVATSDAAVAALDKSRESEFEEYFGGNLGQNLSSTASTREAIVKIAAETGYKSAIIYVMAQPEQLELIVMTGTGQPIRKTVPEAPREKLLEVVSRFRSQLTATRLGKHTDGYRKPALQLYQWLIAPIEGELQAAGINTLLLSMDSGLRSLPMAALYDGQQFLVEKYSMGQIPSISLVDTNYRTLQDTRVLAMGASQFQDLAPLPAVPVELATISEKLWSGEQLINENFTEENLISERKKYPYPIIHLATHGEFKAGAVENSYIQLWGEEKLRLNELRELGWNNPPVELLVLSACRTALGNEQAELGFAGLAVQAGVKTALASLWSVSDEGTLALMTEFYRNLENSKIKAEALRQAQIAMIRGQFQVSAGELRSSGGTRGALALPPELSEVENSNLSHPYYWSAFMMIGSPW